MKYHPRLSDKQVREIRSKYSPRRYTIKMLANEYGVSPGTIKNFILGRTRVSAGGIDDHKGELS